MFFPEARVRVFLYGQAVDMRKSFDGLYAIARAAFADDPTAGNLYAFVSRSGALIKVLYFDRSGWCVWAKRLERGRFVSDWSRARTHEIDCTQLELLLEGIEPGRMRKRWRRDAPGGRNGTCARVRNSDLYGGYVFSPSPRVPPWRGRVIRESG